MSIKAIQAEFETQWAKMFKVYRPLLAAEDGEGLVHRVSAMKGLAWNLYLQGRTDEMGKQLTMERRLSRSRVTALLRRRDA